MHEKNMLKIWQLLISLHEESLPISHLCIRYKTKINVGFFVASFSYDIEKVVVQAFLNWNRKTWKLYAEIEESQKDLPFNQFLC